MDVYLDESGDLGFSDGSSRHFVVVAVASHHPVELSRVLKRIRRRHFRGQYRDMEFKFRSSPEPVRRLVCRGIAATDAQVVWGGIIKNNTSSELRKDKNGLYMRVCGRTVSELTARLRTKSLHLVLDRRSSNRSVRRAFEEHLEQVVCGHHGGYFSPSLEVSHLDSSDVAGIQIADIVAGAIFQSLERSNRVYLDLIADNIVKGGLYW